MGFGDDMIRTGMILNSTKDTVDELMFISSIKRTGHMLIVSICHMSLLVFVTRYYENINGTLGEQPRNAHLELHGMPVKTLVFTRYVPAFVYNVPAENSELALAILTNRCDKYFALNEVTW